MNLIRSLLQTHLNPLRSTMSSGVTKTFLNDSEEAKRNLRWWGIWYTVILDFDLYTVPLAKLFGQLFHGRNKTHIIQTGRMQIMRYGVDICRHAHHLFFQFA